MAEEVKEGGLNLRDEVQGRQEELVTMAFPSCPEEIGHPLKSEK